VKKNIVERTCIVCRQKGDKDNFIRFVRGNDGVISLDKTQKKSGRGCYVCASDCCIEKFKKTKALNRAFKTNVPEETYDRLLQELSMAE